MFLELPDLALGPATVVRRVEQDPRVACLATHFAPRERERVVEHHADRHTLQATVLRLLLNQASEAFEASTCVTEKPARAATRLAMPV